jgi:hypothetical protein
VIAAAGERRSGQACPGAGHANDDHVPRHR